MLPYDSVKRRTLVKREYKTKEKAFLKSVDYLFERGLINLDKPPGPTSHDTTSYVRRILNINKTGHSGTLDPRVTGVLPIVLNRGTKVANCLLRAGKEYVCLMHIHKDVSKEEILQNFDYFRGVIEQLPPIKSSVKRQVRKRNIYSIDVLEIKGRNVLFKVGCEAGTYIRKLVHDFGKKLGTGANMQELRRVRVGLFNEDSSIKLQDLVDAYQRYLLGEVSPIKKIIQPIEKAVEHLPKVWVTDEAVKTIRKGAKLAVPGIVKIDSPIKEDEDVAILSSNEELIAIGKLELSVDEIMKRERGIAFSLKRVI